MRRRLVVVMARWPAAGRCKRRLSTGLGSQRAAAVQQGLLRHTLAVLHQACCPIGADRRLAVAGVGPRAAARLHQGSVVLQGQGGLGLRMQRQFGWAFRQGYQQVLLLGSDLPQLSAADLQQAFAALQRAPLVLGPATDGGYWLIGLRRSAPPLFAGVAWGSDSVLQETVARATSLGLPAALLHCRHDLDRPGDLLRWR
ncbi:MAG: TIGR04282 family arsenosugar biosynthesis glycosyltransferase [Cyanobacteriota bacterium]|nr:TIGR04282 family arsenosugar biosynthesis glycosyltransferase [Cyanobacteriota bacterium]